MMNIRRKSQINDFERLDGDGDIVCDIDSAGPQSKNGEEYPTTTKTSDHYQSIKKSHSVKAIAKAKKLVMKSRYSSLDGAFPTCTAVVVNSDNKKKKSTTDLTGPSVIIPTYIQSNENLPAVTNDETKDEFYFEANFEDVKDPHNNDHYFEAIFEDDCEDSPEINLEESSEQNNTKADLLTKSNPIKISGGRPSTPNTLASSSVSSDSRPSTPGAPVFLSTSAEDSSVDISASSNEMNSSNEMSTPATSSNKTTTKKNFSKKNSSYQNLDHNSASDDDNVQLELDQRLKAIHRLKDVTIEQSKKIKKMQLSDKANKIRFLLFRKEITYLRLQNADLKERVTQLEDDLKMAKGDAVVSEEEANRMCTALVLIRDEIDDAENRAEKMDENIEKEGLFADGEGDNATVPNFDENHSNSDTEEGVEEKIAENDTIDDEVANIENIAIEFDAFGLCVEDEKKENDTL